MNRQSHLSILSSVLVTVNTTFMVLAINKKNDEIAQLKQQLSATVQCQSDILITQP